MKRWSVYGLAVAALGRGDGNGTSTGDNAGGGGAGGDDGVPEITELFVDPTKGADDNAGTKTAPFKTLSKALDEAHGGQRVRLNGGTYSAQTGEDWSRPVRTGVVIEALTPGQAVLVGTGAETALRFEGDSEVRFVRIEHFGQGLVADAGEHTWVGVGLIDNVTGLTLAGSARASADGLNIESTVGGVVSGFTLRGAASLAMTNSAIHDLGSACAHGHIGTVSEAATFEGDGLTIHNANGWLQAGGASRTILSNSTLTEVGPDGCGNGQAITAGGAAVVQLIEVAMAAPRGYAVFVHDVARLVVAGGSIESSELPAVGLSGGAGWIEGTKIEAFSAKYAAVAALSGASLSVSGATLVGCERCVVVDGGSAALRATSFQSASVAVHLAAGTLDLGAPEDPGKNDFTEVTDTALRVTSVDQPQIPASGNYWVDSQGAVFGLYLEGSSIGGPFGCEDAAPRNLCLTEGGTLVRF